MNIYWGKTWMLLSPVNIINFALELLSKEKKKMSLELNIYQPKPKKKVSLKLIPRHDGSIGLHACNEEGETHHAGLLAVISEDGIEIQNGVSRELGFALDDKRRLKTTLED
jgi:hypothetical protein